MRAIEPSLDVKLREFVLGNISDSDRDELERRLFADDEAYDLLVAVEEEVLDECVRGKLPEREMRNVLDYIEKLPDGRARVEFARELCQRASSSVPRSAPREPEEERPARRARSTIVRFFSPTAACSAAALLVGVSIGLLGGDRLSSNRPAPESAVSREAVADGGPASTSPVLLDSATLRSAADSPIVELAPSQRVLDLELDVAYNDYEIYRAALFDVDARELFSAHLLVAKATAERIVVQFSIPTGRLPTGDYFVSLFGRRGSGGEERLGRYAFRLLKR